MGQHGAVASAALGDGELIERVLADYRTAPIPERLRAVLGLIEKLTLEPASVGPDDVAPLRAMGLSDPAIEDALQICAVFQVINRVSDALGFEHLTPRELATGAGVLLKTGYDLRGKLSRRRGGGAAGPGVD